MNIAKERTLSVILVLSLLLSICVGVVSNNNTSLANEKSDININENKVVKGNSIYINSAIGDYIRKDSTLIFENEDGDTKKFLSEYNEDAGYYYFNLNFDEVGNWKLLDSNVSETIEFNVVVYNTLEEMTGHSKGYIDISDLEDTTIEGDKLEYTLTRLKGYTSNGNSTEITATISSNNGEGVFTIYNEGISSTISVPENFTLQAGTHNVKLNVDGYSTSIDLTLNSEYTTVVEEVQETMQEEISTNSGSVTSVATRTSLSTSSLSSSSSTVFKRLAGSDAYKTAIEVSKSKYNTAENVVLVNGGSFHDTGVAAAFAKQKKAPILLTTANTLRAETLNEIIRLKAKNVYIIGGEFVVNAKVATELKNKGINVIRHSGSDQYATSVKTSEELLKITNRGTVIIVSGESYYDSISASALSASKGYPILYVKKGSVPEVVNTAIKKAGYKEAIIIGGPVAINSSVENTIKKNVQTVKRVWGQDMYGTSMAIAKSYFPNTKIFNIATGNGFYDALSGSAVAGVNDSPVIVVRGDTVSTELKNYINGITELKGVYIYGGPIAVSSKFETNLRSVVFSTSSGGEQTTPPVSNISILLDPGHAKGHNRGYLSNTKWKNEGDGNYEFSLILKKELEAYGIKVGTTRPTNTTYDIPLATRGQAAKGYNLLISLHTNAGGGTGVEIFNDVQRPGAEKLATNLTNSISNTLELRNRGVKLRYYGENTSGVNPNNNYYGVLRNNAGTAGMLVEHCFHDNATDVSRYEARATTLAKNMASTIAEYYGSTGNTTPTPNPTPTDINIMGKTSLTKNQMLTYFNSKNSSPKLNCSVSELIDLYIKEGEIEGVDGAVAFVQAMHETGYFKFGGDVDWTQNNYCGLGATGNGAKGNSFSTPQIGVRAHIQHLKAYASTEPLKQTCVDPRFKYVTRGKAPTIAGLAGTWASDKSYGTKLLTIYNSVNAVI